jgi:hypothetical protein
MKLFLLSCPRGGEAEDLGGAPPLSIATKFMRCRTAKFQATFACCRRKPRNDHSVERSRRAGVSQAKAIPLESPPSQR